MQSAEQKSKIATSKSAYCASTADPADQRMARVLSGEIVTDSESDDAEDYLNIESLASEPAREIITKKRLSLCVFTRYAEQRIEALRQANQLRPRSRFAL